MKKLLSSIIIFILAMSIYQTSYAEDTDSAGDAEIPISITGTTTVSQDAESITLSLDLGEFTNVPENSVMGYQAVLEYEDDYFSSVEVTGASGWSATYEESNGSIVAESVSVAKENTSITTFVFKLKSDVQPGKTSIKLNNIKLTAEPLSSGSEGVTIDTEKEVEITINAKETPSEQPDSESKEEQKPESTEEKTKEEQTTKDLEKSKSKTDEKTIKTITNAKEDKTTTGNSLPKTGKAKLAIVLITIAVISAFSLIRYKTIKIK